MPGCDIDNLIGIIKRENFRTLIENRISLYDFLESIEGGYEVISYFKIFPPCTCSKERMEEDLSTTDDDILDSLFKKGTFDMTCFECGRVHTLNRPKKLKVNKHS